MLCVLFLLLSTGCCFFRLLADGQAQFYLYTSEAGPEPMVTNDTESMQSTHFNPCAKTIFLVTGLNAAANQRELIDAALRIASKRYNVVIVDFENDDYVSDTLAASTEIAFFLESLEVNLNANREHIVLIGISLGAHIVGLTSQLYRVGRIIGADPAGPIYDLLPREVRLDRTDADHVQIVLSSKVYGSWRTKAGHMIIVINGGRNQPLCEPLDFYCHHVRAALLLVSSVDTCSFVAKQCFAYWAYAIGLCDGFPTYQINIDLDIETAPRNGETFYYDTTADDYPYCLPEEQSPPPLNPIFCDE